MLYLHKTYFVFPHQKNDIFNTHESSTPHICYLSSSHNLLIYEKVGRVVEQDFHWNFLVNFTPFLHFS